MSALGSVVIIVQLRIGSPLSGSIQRSHNPAKPNRGWSLSVMYIGVFVPSSFFRHSKKPSAGMMQRRLLSATRKACFSAALSERALIILAALLVSFAHEGISPQCIGVKWLCPSASRTTVAIVWDGATL